LSNNRLQGDALQRPLLRRSRFQARLSAGVKEINMPTKTTKKEFADQLVSADANLQSALAKFLHAKGDKIAKEYGYNNLYGIEAVYYYLIQKHNWLPSQVKGMSYDDLSFCLEDLEL
jgi:hypothetical protein